MRVLMSDGSGLTARQVATQLAIAGHPVEALTPDPLALTRVTRRVRRVHRVPPYGADPFAWLDTAPGVFATGHIDVLVPTQEQVAVLARRAHRLDRAGVVTAVPPFDVPARVQDNLAAHATLAEVGLPQPRGRRRADQRRAGRMAPAPGVRQDANRHRHPGCTPRARSGIAGGARPGMGR